MTRNKLFLKLAHWQQTCKDMHREWDALAACIDAAPDGRFGTVVFRMMDAYTDAVADALGIPPSGRKEFKDDLDWYAHENEFGAKGLDVTVNRRKRAIRTPADLAWLVWPTIKGKA